METDERTSATPLPAAVAAEVARRRATILARAAGRVLDLDRPEARTLLATTITAMATSRAPSASVPPSSPPERFDTIISTVALIDQPDLGAAIAALDHLLADDGELLVVEPVNRPGTAGLLWSSLGATLSPVAGRHVSRDVIRTVRAAGLTVADLDRFTMATRVWPLRRFVEARIIRIPRHHAAPEEPS